MEWVLKEDVTHLGEAGDVVQVAKGYARNYLVPKKLAAPATPEMLKQVEKIKSKRAAIKAREQQAQAAVAENLTDASCTVTVKVNEEGTLFGSVNVEMIVEAFVREGMEVQPEWIHLDDPIKTLGVYAIKIRIAEDLEVEAKVWVVEE